MAADISGTLDLSSFASASSVDADEFNSISTSSAELPSVSRTRLCFERPSTLVDLGFAEPVVRERPVRHAGLGNLTIRVDLNE